MEGFSYNDIFETKGIEYIVVIAFLLILIPFWLILNKTGFIITSIKKVVKMLSFDNLKIPQGIFYGKNHTWAFMERSGSVSLGLDDFLLHIVGEVKLKELKNPGEIIHRGDLLTEITKENKALKIISPVSGEIINSNLNLLYGSPEILGNDPYGQGWVYKIKPTNWKEESRSLYLAEEASNWLKKEMDRLKDFLAASRKKYSPEPSLLIMQDGGELMDHTLSELPEVVWNDFQENFLNEIA